MVVTLQIAVDLPPFSYAVRGRRFACVVGVVVELGTVSENGLVQER